MRGFGRSMINMAVAAGLVLPACLAADETVERETSLSLGVNHHVRIRLVARDRYDSTPPAESEKNNLQVIGAMVFTL